MKKILCLILTVVMITFCFCGCANEIVEGKVIEKKFEESYTITQLIPISRRVGKITTVTMIPYIVHHPDNYIITISNEVNGEEVKRRVYVSKKRYNNIQVGDNFKYDENVGDSDNEKCVKEKAKTDEEEKK